MGDNWSYRSPARPLFRVAALILSLLAAPFGVMAISGYLETRESLSDLAFGIGALGWSLVFLVVAIRGAWLPGRKTTTLVDRD